VPEDIKTQLLCHVAVQNFGMALTYVPEPLKTSELCLVAVQSAIRDFRDQREFGKMIESLPESLNTPGFYQAIVQCKNWSLSCIPEGQRTLELCIASVNQNPKELRYVPLLVKSKDFYGAIRQIMSNGDEDDSVYDFFTGLPDEALTDDERDVFR